ncbi:uncharacterized protein (TIGR02646 family) [Parabacteroides sp. PFB2-12]|uniref:retron system putative HNH endonuclease n=1 Tax=unclassified Parabacteroides TaxID=2649774 RepID=UPI002473E4EA|nr:MULTISPECIES: retron system putative HNH endonuclease [unclassified Parabacteroides]MDH6343384.1 uncharacterized protein (TIGR02646 family) [Parabacteroides sp. PM6-13]MDH6390400.1 uncharacterized protein (TIGR02646 family) [Parabacteroides sp. PFB2-12]
MKRIDKEAPSFFSAYIRENKPERWEDITPIRADLRAHILNEQEGVCAYTEIRLPDFNKNCHIDHFRKRDHFPKLTFDYANLLVSCNSEEYGAKHKDKVITSGEYGDLINPVEESAAGHIEFTSTGKVNPLTAKGEKTITTFNLNAKSLTERRKDKAFCLSYYIKDEFTEDDIVQSIGEFETMIRQLYREMA